MSLLDRLRRVAADPYQPADPELVARLDATGALLAPAVVADRRKDWWIARPWAGTACGAALAGADDAQLRAAALWGHRELLRAGLQSDRQPDRRVYADLITAMVKRKLRWTPEEAVAAYDWMIVEGDKNWGYWFLDRARVPVAALEACWGAVDVPTRRALEPGLRRLITSAERAGSETRQRRAVVRRLTVMLDGDEMRSVPLVSLVRTSGPSWEGLPTEVQTRLRDADIVSLLAHCAGLSSVAPSAAWTKKASALVAACPDGVTVLAALLSGLLWLGETPGRHEDDLPVWIGEPTETTLRGVVAVYAVTAGPNGAGLLADVAVAAGTGFGGSGGSCRSTRLVNTAVAVLGRMDGTEVVAALSRVQARVKNKTVLKGVVTALEGVADRAGMTPEQLLERAVPTHGLTGVGLLERTVGEHTARITVTPVVTALGFHTSDGRALKGVPASVKDHHADALAELRRAVAELRKTLTTQRLRVEDLMAAGRTWTGSEWRELYLDHPLTGVFTRGLIWEVSSGTDSWTAGWIDDDGTLRSLDGSDLSAPAAAAVRLWHPALVPTDEVRTWRERLTDREIRQPFKQAFREVYLLTPAEVTTGLYSNRYAAHIVRYPQFGALLRARGWSGNHLGYWDGGYEGAATKDFGHWRAEFFYDLAEVEAPDYASSPPYASTDQVRFHRREGGRWAQVRVDAVPALVFTEAMRDADLFVGVTSIAADPAWTDGGEVRFRDYWQRESFGDLTESAQTRREALLRLMPRTKIADRVEVGARFLVVHGDLRTYKIHLGSGNILMEPNDAYLCIVVARGTGARRQEGTVFLPFEEDGGLLSVIVSKAFLLADDTTITDRTILAQIRR